MMKLTQFSRASLTICLFLMACGSSDEPARRTEPAAMSPALWGQRAEGTRWTASALNALDGHGAALVNTVPADIKAYCPGYVRADPEDRKMFWVTFLSALARHESTWRPDVSGGDGGWHGLLQISPGTARGHGCTAQSAEALKNGGQNLACGIRIMARTVPRDGVISQGMGGVAADWGPFHQAAKRADIQARTRAAAACRE